ncbi:replication factor C large subunit [Candidatus Woesearchaeota archaeon]|nr:replication factor C large subunit [Candidatus Woesearchaeota archaeon]
MIPWIKKYEPRSLSEIKGQDEAIKYLKDFIENKKRKKSAVILYGPSGNGKTSSAYALAKEYDLEILEVNASDFRNKDKIESNIGQATKQLSLFGKSKIILVDEIDGLSGKEDRGGIQAITKVIDESSFPIILTSNNPFDMKFSTLRKRCNLVEFKSLDHNVISDILKNICRKEKIRFEEDVLKALARREAGDLRGAITDLQLISAGSDKITMQSLEQLGDRMKMESIVQALVKIFKTTDPNIALSAFDTVDEDFDKIFLWIDENLPLEYDNPEDLADAYNCLSKADVFKRRIKRWQHWRFLVYINVYLTAGIATSKKEKYKKFIKYKPTSRLLKLWWAKQKNMKKKAICQKIAEKTHSSQKQIYKDTFPYFKHMFKNNKQLQKNFIEEFDLNKEEVEWLKK